MRIGDEKVSFAEWFRWRLWLLAKKTYLSGLSNDERSDFLEWQASYSKKRAIAAYDTLRRHVGGDNWPSYDDIEGSK